MMVYNEDGTVSFSKDLQRGGNKESRSTEDNIDNIPAITDSAHFVETDANNQAKEPDTLDGRDQLLDTFGTIRPAKVFELRGGMFMELQCNHHQYHIKNSVHYVLIIEYKYFCSLYTCHI